MSRPAHGQLTPLLTAVFSMPGRARWQVRGLDSARGDRAASALADAAAKWDGVRHAQASGYSGQLLVLFDPARTDAQAVAATATRFMAENGGISGLAAHAVSHDVCHHPHTHHHDHDHDHGDDYVGRLWLGGAVLAGLGLKRLLLGASPFSLSPLGWTVGALTTVITGLPYFKGGVKSLRQERRMTTDTLISTATLSSLALGENVTALVVLWLLNLGEHLQALTLRRTRQALQNLLQVSDREVWLVHDADTKSGEGGREQRVPIEEIAVGNVLAVYTGEKVPVDGHILSGQATLDEAPITGESMLAYKMPGQLVFAGTVMHAGSIRVLAAKIGDDTVVGRLIRRVEQAQELQAPIQTLGNMFARRFVPFSFALSALTWVFTRDLRRSLTMLVVACPCASGLATPTAVSASIGNAARRGILIKGGTHLEGIGRVDTVVFDKTGTLTVGHPRVTHVLTLDANFSPEDILMLAGTGELHSQHPLALAVLKHLNERELLCPPHEECEVLVGRGMRADVSGARVLVGSQRLMEEFEIVLSQEAVDHVATFSDRGETVLFVARNDALIGMLGVADVVREDALNLLERLRELGVTRVMMLTGDSPEVAAKVAERLGISSDNVRAGLFPEDKFEIVRRLQADGRRVAMVGDGINDAPALAIADVGIAMGASGSDVAIEAADIALATNDISRIADVILLGQRALGVIRQNYGLAIGVNGGGVLVGAAGALNPVLAALLHNLSTILVVINSSRLIRYREVTG
ncbi:MAG: cation-translocating P-type ATPase [Armatimonadetes bacterium]|nr:cation-translocating P-type ATPase [Armatimonadota bacterium]